MQLENRKKYSTGISCQFYGKVKIGRNSVLGNYVIVGYPKESRIFQLQQDIDIASEKYPQLLHKVKPTVMGTNCKIDSQVVIHEGTLLGNNVIIDDFCRIGYDCVIGEDTRIVYGAFVCDRVKIDNNSVIAGFICDGVVIKDHCTVMGQLVHKYNNPQMQWGVEETPPFIEHHVVIGFNALVVGGIKIGHHSYVTAGTIVTKDVPPKSVVIGINKIIANKDWKGKELSKYFWTWK